MLHFLSGSKQGTQLHQFFVQIHAGWEKTASHTRPHAMLDQLASIFIFPGPYSRMRRYPEIEVIIRILNPKIGNNPCKKVRKTQSQNRQLETHWTPPFVRQVLLENPRT